MLLVLPVRPQVTRPKFLCLDVMVGTRCDNVWAPKFNEAIISV